MFAPDPQHDVAEPAWFAVRNDRLVSILPACADDREFGAGIMRARTLFDQLGAEF